MSFWDVPGVKAGVITGDAAWGLLKHAKDNGYAIPAFNCTSTSTINSVLEAGKKLGRPVIIQFSEGGAAFMAGKSLPNEKGVLQASILGAIAGAQFARAVAPAYGIPVLVHSDHCAKKLLPWFDGMLEADEAYFKLYGEPLFSSHMLDLSEEPDEENIAICQKYLKRMAPMKCILEMEIGITGGVEDGVDNSGAAKEKLYSTPEDVYAVYTGLSPISEMFTIAAAFGNVHGVYKAGNVVLRPELLGEFQAYASKKVGSQNPLFFVFHGGSGSEKHHITTALGNGVVKMNVDTDTQWAYWSGLKNFYQAKSGYLQGQIGNPEGADKPNKSYYDPRKWIRESETSMVKRVQESCTDLGNHNFVTPKRKPIVGGNWKCNPECSSKLDGLVKNINACDASLCDVYVCPSTIHVTEVIPKISNAAKVCPQNCNFKGCGAYTGEMAVEQMKDLGLQWVMIGHSERREYFEEDDTLLATKLKYILDAGMKCIFCIGEKLPEREKGLEATMAVCISQLEQVKGMLDPVNVVIAYEPVWAIGTGVTATAAQAQETHAAIRKWIAANVSAECAAGIRIQYGGSANAKNAPELSACPDIDGFLVGGASLKPEFAEIVDAIVAEKWGKK